MLTILFTTEAGPTRATYFPKHVLQTLEGLGNVLYNPYSRPLSEAELGDLIGEADICLTHWGSPSFTPAVLAQARRLKLIAHAAGSVADLVSPQVYQMGIRVVSANRVLAKTVAESVLAYILAGLKQLPQQVEDVKVRQTWGSQRVLKSLHGARIALVGLGTIGRFLLELLAPFQVQVKIYDPYIQPAALSAYPNASLDSLEEVLRWGEVVSLHASLTPETYHLLGAQQLALLGDGALLVNTARGQIIDQAALVTELQNGRIQAVLDVFEKEPLPRDSPLRTLDNVLLFPHSAGVSDRGVEMTLAVLGEIERFLRREALQHEITFEQWRLMTRERQFRIYQ